MPGNMKGIAGTRAAPLGLLCRGKLDDELIRLDLDADHMRLHDAGVVVGLLQFEMLPDGFDHQRLDLDGRHPRHRSGFRGPPIEQGG